MEKEKNTNRQPCEIFSRVNGYLRPIQQWNDAKVSEWNHRINFKKYE